MVGATRVGFKVLSVAYGYCWAGCAGKIMLAKATWLPGTTPLFSMVRDVLERLQKALMWLWRTRMRV